MQIARPPGGFDVVVTESVATYIAAESRDNFRVEQFWKDMLARLKFTALKEGTSLKSNGCPTFSFVANGAVDFGIPTIQVVYECFGRTLTVTAALVWTEEDYEDSSYN